MTKVDMVFVVDNGATANANAMALQVWNNLFQNSLKPQQQKQTPNPNLNPRLVSLEKSKSNGHGLRLRKRSLNLSIVALICNGLLANWCEATDFLERYTDSKEGFTLLVPSSFNKVEKAGATVLFEQASNNVGVVVNPVRLTSLSEFGSPEFVVDKLIQAEKRKESTKDAELLGVAERCGQGGVQVYEFEYKVDSTRGGMKRIFSAAFVASNKLYLLNIAHSEATLDSKTTTMLQQVLHSFDAAPHT